MADDDSDEQAPNERRSLVMRLIVFQLKLLADGIRDLLLSPISIAATVMGLLDRNKAPDHYFQQLLHLGRRSDVFIDLFDAHRNDSQEATTRAEEMAREAKRRFEELETEYSDTQESHGADPARHRGGEDRDSEPESPRSR